MAESSRVLVTGATGFLGRHLVPKLLGAGYTVRALVRDAAECTLFNWPEVEICVGDIANKESLNDAFDGVDFVVHAAADTAGTLEGGRQVTIGGTAHVLEACHAAAVKKLVYISSCSVYQIAGLSPASQIEENSPLERVPEQRGAYSWAKTVAEEHVRQEMESGRFPIVCLRPGTIYGAGGQLFSPMIGLSLRNKLFAVFGNGRSLLPLVHVENLADVITLCLQQKVTDGQIYTVVDPQPVSKRNYLQKVIKPLYPSARTLYIPYGLFKWIVRCQEWACKRVGRAPFLSLYRLESSQNPITYDGSKIMSHLNWQPGVSFEQAAEKIVATRNAGTA